MPLSPPKRFSTPKAGNRADECEDDARVVYAAGKNGLNTARIALSDGASESAFARSWAQILTEAFVRRPLDLSTPTQCALESWLAPSQQEWDRKVPWDRIPWHGEAKARAGALATLMALSIEPKRSGRPSWEAVAVGDSCLFVVREDDLLLSFPLEDPAQFNNTPALICSNPANNRRLGEQVRQSQGEWAPGDLFIMASDALACWILERDAAGGKPWETLLALDSPVRWDDWVQAQRREHTMKNDDTTLIIVKVR